MEPEFSRQIFEKQTTNFMKIRPVGPELFHAEGQTDRHDETNSRFMLFCERAIKDWGGSSIVPNFVKNSDNKS
jgi:hypothetical protein